MPSEKPSMIVCLFFRLSNVFYTAGFIYKVRITSAACLQIINVSNSGTISIFISSAFQPLKRNKPYTSIAFKALLQWLIIYRLHPSAHYIAELSLLPQWFSMYLSEYLFKNFRINRLLLLKKVIYFLFLRKVEHNRQGNILLFLPKSSNICSCTELSCLISSDAKCKPNTSILLIRLLTR